MTNLALVMMVGIPLWLGYVLVTLCGVRPKDDPIAFWGWMYVTGCLGTAVYLLGWLFVGLPLPTTTPIPLAIACAVLHWRIFRLNRKKGRVHPPVALTDAVPDASGVFRLAFFAVLLGALTYAGFTMASGNAEAIVSGDEIKHWTLKAKMIYSANGFSPDYEEFAAIADRPEGYWDAYDAWLSGVWPQLDEFMKRRFQSPGTNWLYHLDYPLLNPLLHVWTYTCAGEVVHWQNRILIQLFGVALLLILAGTLRRLTHPGIAALLLIVFFALVETRSAFHKSLADGMVAVGLLITVDALSRYRETLESRWWRLMILGLCILVWSKNEGLMYVVALVAGCASVRFLPDWREALWLAAPLTLVTYTWISNATYGFTNDLVTAAAGGGAERMGPLLRFYWNQVVFGPTWATHEWELNSNWLYALFGVLAVAMPRFTLIRPIRIVTVTVVTMCGMQFLVYLTTPHELEWHLVHSALRIAWQGLPIVVWWIAIASLQLLPTTEES